MTAPPRHVITNANKALGMVMSYDGTKIWMATEAKTIDCLRTSDRTIISSVPSGSTSNIHFLILNFGGSYIYYANSETGNTPTLFRYNTATTLIDTFAISILPLSLSREMNTDTFWASIQDIPGDESLYKIDASNFSSVIVTKYLIASDLDTSHFISTIHKVGNNLAVITQHPTYASGHYLYLFEIISGSPVFSTKYLLGAGDPILNLCASYDGSYVYCIVFSTVPAQMYRINISTGVITQIFAGHVGNPFQILLSNSVRTCAMCISYNNQFVWFTSSLGMTNDSVLVQLDTITLQVAVSHIWCSNSYSIIANPSMASPLSIWASQTPSGDIIRYSVPITNTLTYTSVSANGLKTTEMFITADSQYGFIVDEASNIIRVNLSTLSVTIIGTTKGTFREDNICMSHNGSYILYISNEKDVTIINTSTLSIIQLNNKLQLLNYIIEIIPDINNNSLFWAVGEDSNDDPSIVSINISNVNTSADDPVVTDFTSTIYASLAVNERINRLAISPNGNNLYASISSGINVGKIFNWVISTGSPVIASTPSYTTALSTLITFLCVSPDGLYLYYIQSLVVYKFTLSNSTITTLLATGDAKENMVISTNGLYLWLTELYSNVHTYGTSIVQINTSTLEVLHSEYFLNSYSIISKRTGSSLWFITDGNDTYIQPQIVNYSVPLMPISIPCFCPGTRILTTTGYKVVEDLTTDDLAVTSDGRHVNIIIFKRFIEKTNKGTAPYCIPAGSFGKTMPINDLCLSPIHTFLDENGVWQCAKYIEKEGVVVKQFGIGEPMLYYHIECPNYFTDNLIAEGMFVESYKHHQGPSGVMYTWNNKINGFIRNSIDQITPPSIFDRNLKLCSI